MQKSGQDQFQEKINLFLSVNHHHKKHFLLVRLQVPKKYLLMNSHPTMIFIWILFLVQGSATFKNFDSWDFGISGIWKFLEIFLKIFWEYLSSPLKEEKKFFIMKPCKISIIHVTCPLMEMLAMTTGIITGTALKM